MSQNIDNVFVEPKVRPYKILSLTSIGFVCVFAMIGLAITTYSIIAGLTDMALTEDVIYILIGVNIFAIVVLTLLISFQIFRLSKARKSNVAGANLHSRLVFYFSVMSAIPAILVAVFSSLTLSQGLDNYFSERTKKVIDNSQIVAELYNDSHATSVWSSAEALAQVINRIYPLYQGTIETNPTTRKNLEIELEVQVLFKQLDGALIWNANKDQVLAKYDNYPDNKFPRPWDSSIREATDEGITKLKTPSKSLILIYLENFDLFLYVYRNIDPIITQQILSANRSRQEYLNLEKQTDDVQIVFALMYIGIGLALVLSAIWIGFRVADQLITPIRRLINAAQMVSAGHYQVALPINRNEGDLADLSLTFNEMTQRLTDQRQDLITANEDVDTRRRFNEAMLSGVSAGVIGLDIDHNITLLNGPAELLLNKTNINAIGKKLDEISPELGEALANLFIGGLKVPNGQISLGLENEERILNYRITEEISGDHNEGFVITLDDITDLVTAQRTSAWSDIARRIAHEIKNPLTPIQLSAERLRRRYRKKVPEDDTVFDQCIDTIVRQVGDIGNMVDEFASFAKMPSATLKRGDIVKSIKEAIFLQKVGNPNIDIFTDLPDDAIELNIDRRLVTQVITNIVKNATESIETAFSDKILKRESDVGKIYIAIEQKHDCYNITISDNGIGLPKTGRHKLLEPYMTTRSKGTGLGLAIVKHIMEEHLGSIYLGDAAPTIGYDHGAKITLSFPVLAEDTNEVTGVEDGG
ncbi:MAG: PAS domain-containing sensor histidine kinase [Rhizobiales bacterium]|nr:PAS domain-containing sensor histidine kinase [Hyphomicrobiales bacterium]NRB14860.1 PAS domain-containing sensor histidine kinase [Hyphomicrobiales bacterium]